MKQLAAVVIALLVCSGLSRAQNVTLRTVTALPTQVQETSGLFCVNPGFFWTHNDSGNDPIIFKVDTNGVILRSIRLRNVINNDWEDITLADNDSCYIGDFGNNNNNRKDLKILIIPNPENIVEDTITPQIIRFSYSNQSQFPPPDSLKNFDAEAFIHFNHHIYIFSKNYTNPFSGMVYMYRLPDAPGTYVAELIDSIKTGQGSTKELWWVTSASISTDKKTLGLLSSDKMYVFTKFTGDAFFKGKYRLVYFNNFSQKEGLAFYNNYEFYITDEKNTLFGGMKLYQGSLKEILTASAPKVKPKPIKLVSLHHTDSGQVLNLIDDHKTITVSVLDASGRTVKKYALNRSQPSVVLDINKGYYTLVITDGKTRQELSTVIR